MDNDVAVNKLDFLKSKYNLSDTSDLAAALWQDQKVYDQISSKNIGSPWKYLSDYVDDKIDDPDIDKIVGITKAAKKVETAADKAEDTIKLKKAEDKLKKAEEELKHNVDMSTKYSGIWKEDVTLADYESKKGKIAAKKKYFEDQIDKYSGPAYADYAWASKEIEKFEDLLQGLEEFEEEGKAASKYLKAVEAAKKEVRALTPVSDTFSDARKDAAIWAKNKTTEYKKVDKYFDGPAAKVHATRTPIETEAYEHYTWGSMPFNSPLAGYKGDRYTNFVGVNKVDIDVNGYGDRIRGLTALVEKSTCDKDFWMQSAQGHETIEAFLNIPMGTLDNMTVPEAQQFIGVQNEIPQFISGAINKGGGSYNPGNMTVNIYVPSGSEALYVREDGHFGKAEHEMILQRGGTYKVTKIYRDIGTHGKEEWIVDLEVHPECGYDKFQQKK